MNVNRILEVTNGDPLGTLRNTLGAWWEEMGFEALVAAVEQPETDEIALELVQDREELACVNPFAPLMLQNSARFVGRILQEQPSRRIAAILRPCELRALIELRKRGQVSYDADRVVLIGVDCLGTFSQAEYSRSLQARGQKPVTDEVLRNAAEGGLRAQRFRTACQVCDWPAPCGADLTIGVIGVPTAEILLVIARDEKLDERLGLAALTSDFATEYQVSHRETVVGAIADMRAGVRKKLIESLQGEFRFNDFASLLAWLANCSMCGNCLDACPIYRGELDGLLGKPAAQKDRDAPLAELVQMSRWLASCSGCGMCQEACTCNVPLTLLISALSHRVRGEMRYRCGDPAQQLPWANG
jgi:formate dehydrogenase subunit beta